MTSRRPFLPAAKVRLLVAAAKHAQARAYCPYSRYPVGAAILADSGRIYAGANVENASFGLSLCAERVAIFNAVTRGEKGLRAVCVIGKRPKPCGACRQVIQEFSTKDTALILVDLDGSRGRESVTVTRTSAMLPQPFDPFEAGLLANPDNLIRSRRRTGSRKGRKRRR